MKKELAFKISQWIFFVVALIVGLTALLGSYAVHISRATITEPYNAGFVVGALLMCGIYLISQFINVTISVVIKNIKQERLMPKRYWIPTIIMFGLFTAYFGVQAWAYLHTPIVLDYFYNPTLKMYEPIEVSPLPDTWNIVFLLPVMVGIWWQSPLYIFLPFNLFVVWCVFLIIAFRPCISVR